jgi:histidinol-phosphate aminotransferase
MRIRAPDDPLFEPISYGRRGPGRRDRLSPAHIEQIVRTVSRTPEVMVKVLPSAANFIFARLPGRDGAEIAAKLRERSIIVRHFSKPARIADFMRITVGTDEQCAGLVDALRKIV